MPKTLEELRIERDAALKAANEQQKAQVKEDVKQGVIPQELHQNTFRAGTLNERTTDEIREAGLDVTEKLNDPTFDKKAIDQLFYDNQSWYGNLGRSVARAPFVGSAQAARGFTYLLDATSMFGPVLTNIEQLFNEDVIGGKGTWDKTTNSFAEYLKGLEENARADQFLGMDSNWADPSKDYKVETFDRNWWSQGVGGALESAVSFGMIGGGVGMGMKALVSKAALAPLLEQAVVKGASALATNYVESVISSDQLYDDVYIQVLDKTKDETQAKKAAWTAQRKYILENKIWAVGDYIALGGILSGKGMLDETFKRSFAQNAIKTAKSVGNEMVEEFGQDWSATEIKRNALINNGIIKEQEGDDTPLAYADRMWSFAKNEGWESAFWGGVGGPMQSSLSRLVGMKELRRSSEDPGIFNEQEPTAPSSKKPNVSQDPGSYSDWVEGKYMTKKLDVETLSKAKSGEIEIESGDLDNYKMQQETFKKDYESNKEAYDEHKQYEKSVEDYGFRKAEHEQKVKEYNNKKVLENTGTVKQAVEDVQAYIKSEAELKDSYKKAMETGDDITMQDIENQRMEMLFLRYAKRGAVGGGPGSLQHQLKEVAEKKAESPEEQEQKEIAKKFLEAIPEFRKQYIEMLRDKNKSKMIDFAFKNKARLASTEKVLQTLDAEIQKDILELANKSVATQGEAIDYDVLKTVSLGQEEIALKQVIERLGKNDTEASGALKGLLQNKVDALAKQKDELLETLKENPKKLDTISKLSKEKEFLTKLNKDIANKANAYEAYEGYSLMQKGIDSGDILKKANRTEVDFLNEAIDKADTLQRIKEIDTYLQSGEDTLNSFQRSRLGKAMAHKRGVIAFKQKQKEQELEIREKAREIIKENTNHINEEYLSPSRHIKNFKKMLKGLSSAELEQNKESIMKDIDSVIKYASAYKATSRVEQKIIQTLLKRELAKKEILTQYLTDKTIPQVEVQQEVTPLDNVVEKVLDGQDLNSEDLTTLAQEEVDEVKADTLQTIATQIASTEIVEEELIVPTTLGIEFSDEVEDFDIPAEDAANRIRYGGLTSQEIIKEWLEETLDTDKVGMKVSFQLDTTATDKASLKALAAYKSGNRDKETLAFLPIKTIILDAQGKELYYKDRRVEAYYPTTATLEGEDITKNLEGRKTIINAITQGKAPKAKINYVGSGKYKSTEDNRNVEEVFGKGATLLMSDGHYLYESYSKNNKKIAETKGDKMISNAENNGYIFAKTLAPNGKSYPVRLNARFLNENEINVIWKSLSNILGGQNPAAEFKQSGFKDVSNRDVLNMLIHVGPKTKYNTKPFFVDFKAGVLSVAGKDIPFNSVNETEIKAYLRGMRRTTDSRAINSTMNNIKPEVFTFFGKEIQPTDSYNSFMFSDNALETNTVGEDGKVFKHPRVELNDISQWSGTEVKITNAPVIETPTITEDTTAQPKVEGRVRGEKAAKQTVANIQSTVLEETQQVSPITESIDESVWDAFNTFGAPANIASNIVNKMKGKQILSKREYTIAKEENLEGFNNLDQNNVSLAFERAKNAVSLIEAGFSEGDIRNMTQQQVMEEIKKVCER